MREHSIFFDLDDTLYDRSEPFKRAFLGRFPEQAGIAQQAYWTCEKRGNEVFLPSQRGEITMDEMYIYRYQKGLADVGIRITSDEALDFQQVYRERQKEICLGAGVAELLDFCCANFRTVGLITNGPAEKQRGKVKTLGLSKWISGEQMLISGMVGIDKPDPAIFHLAEERAETEPGKMIFVGDSLPNDIRPAAQLGWKTVFLNRKPTEPEFGGICPDLCLTAEEILMEEHIRKLFE